MDNFSKILKEDDLIFYPGCGNDLQPLFAPVFRAKNRKKRTFVFCDFNEDIISFFKTLKRFPDEANHFKFWKRINLQYSSFFDSHKLNSITKTDFELDNIYGIQYVKMELELTNSSETYKSKLHFLGTDAETYLKKCHQTLFSEYKIRCILYIKQHYRELSRNKRFFNYSNFNYALNKHNLLKDAEFLVADNRDIVDSDIWRGWLNSSDSTLAGWGTAGNSMEHSNSARIYQRLKDDEKPTLSDSDNQEVEKVDKSLKQLKFNL